MRQQRMMAQKSYLGGREVLEGDGGAAVHVLVLVLRRAVDDLDLVVVHQDAPGHRALALPVVLGRREHREHAAYGRSVEDVGQRNCVRREISHTIEQNGKIS